MGKRKINNKQDVIERIAEQIQNAQRFGIRLRYVTIRHDQVNELANLAVKGIADKKGLDDADLMQRAVDSITDGTAKWGQLPVVVVGEERQA